MKKVLLFLLTAFVTQLSFGQSAVNFSAEIRGRTEMDNRDFNSATDPYFFTGMRTRFGAALKPESDLSGFIQIQDTRNFGTEPNTLADTKNLDIHQAYFEAKNILGSGLSFKGGRMEFNLGPQRLIGSVGWSNIGRSFDGVLLSYQTKEFDLHAFGFQIGESFLKGDSLDQILGGLYAELKFIPNHLLTPFLIAEKILKTDNLNRYTMGFYLKGNIDNFFHEVEFAYQTGKIFSSSRNLNINAFMAALSVGYKFDGAVKPVLNIGIDYLSGDDNAADNDYKVFNTLYATNHKYYGYMDIFINLPTDTYGAGLTDLHAKFSLMPIEKLSTAFDFHYFLSSANVALPKGGTSKSFGTEEDLTVTYKSSQHLNLTWGFSLFSPGEIFKQKGRKDSSTWMYLMSTFSI